jgi:hypothetical protein
VAHNRVNDNSMDVLGTAKHGCKVTSKLLGGWRTILALIDFRM